MRYRNLFFDLDGTLTDSGEGIINCAALALTHFGLPVPDREAMRIFVGPPLRETLQQFGVREDQTEEAVCVFRERYTSVGKYENFPYPGIRELLETLQARGFHLFVATSKPETMAVDILDKFELSRYFEGICGATLDGVRDTKEKVIACLLERLGTVSDALMIGDTEYDVIGAAVHGIPTVGVAWGYGDPAAVAQAGAVAMVRTPEELLEFLNN